MQVYFIILPILSCHSRISVHETIYKKKVEWPFKLLSLEKAFASKLEDDEEEVEDVKGIEVTKHDEEFFCKNFQPQLMQSIDILSNE